MSSGEETVRTRPSPRVLVVALLVLLVYGAGANVGAGTVLLLAAGMAVGAAWSVGRFLRGVGDLRVDPGTTVVLEEGTGALTVRVTVPPGVIGVLGLAPRLPSEDASRLLAVLGATAGHGGSGPSAAPLPSRWAALPRPVRGADVTLPTLLRRGDAQQLLVELDLTDAFGLVRRRWTLRGPLVHVVAVPGVPGERGAAPVEGAQQDVRHVTVGHTGTPDTELRPWRPGEGVRAVHWPASERADQLLTRPRTPETRRHRTLSLADRTWSIDELDAACRDLTATARELVRAGVDVEVAAAGQLVPWGPDARLLLASLPPNATGEVA